MILPNAGLRPMQDVITRPDVQPMLHERSAPRTIKIS